MITDNSIHGCTVLSGDGLRIGTVVQLVVDPQDWRVRALEVKLDNEVADRIGAHHGLLRAATIGIPTDQVQSFGDAIILGIPVDALRGALPPQ